jgi:hypothetical protein
MKTKFAFLICSLLSVLTIEAQWATDVIPKGITATTFGNSCLKDNGGVLYTTNAHMTFSTTTGVINWGGGTGDLLFRRLSTMGNVVTFLTNMTIKYDGKVGIRSTAPQNRLEITSVLTDPQPAGLRFTNLTCTATPISQCNTVTPVFLSVNNNGDVILVNGVSTGVAPGICPSLNTLGSGLGYNLSGNNFYFDGQGPIGTNAVVIGGNCATFPLVAKLHVLQQDPTAIPTINAVSRAIGGTNADLSGSSGQVMVGVGGQSILQDPTWPTNRPIHTGGRFQASGGFQNYGVHGTAPKGTTVGSEFYGGFFESNFTTAGSLHYGVYGRSTAAPLTGLGPNWAGFFDGDVAGSIFFVTSDRNLKKDIKQLENSLSVIKMLNPVSYNYDTENHRDIGLNHNKQYGFISQEVKEILPDLTSPIIYPSLKDDQGNEIRKKQEYLGLNYDGFIAILTKAVQEQQQQIDELKAILKNSNENTIETSKVIGSVTLNDAQVIVLEQNVPNPFAEQTSIAYNLTDGAQKAQILFYNSEGKLINSSELKATAGKGHLNVFASDLSNGIYSYTLVIDGKIVETKRMIKTK